MTQSTERALPSIAGAEVPKTDLRAATGRLSPEAHARMDREVQTILERLYLRTREVLENNRESLAALAVALLDRETIEGDEAVEIMDEAGLTRPAWLNEALTAPLAPEARLAS